MRARRWVLVAPFLLVAPASAETTLTPPVDALITRAFDPPDRKWGPGHRGIDYALPYGSPVRAAGPGTVTFAGRVASHLAVTIDHGGGVESTYSWLSEVNVSADDAVSDGTWIAQSGYAHEGDDGLHLGVKVDGRYVDPMLHLGPLDTSHAIALAPLDDSDDGRCDDSDALPADVPPPNDNVVVVVGGIASSSASPPDLFDSVAQLGYREDSIYRFSYRGPDGPDLHEPYTQEDTFGSIRVAAEALRRLLERISHEHLDRNVDIVAHSQGGIVARAYLAEQAQTWDERAPRVQHLVTFASPHQGVPAIGEIDELRRGPLLSRGAVEAWDALSNGDLPLPPPDAVSLGELRPGSTLLKALAKQDVAYGTRVLALSIPNDVVVPAVRAEYPGKPHRTVPSEGVFGHSEITRSRRALGMAHAFLAGAGAPCPPDLGAIDSHLGAMIDFGQSVLGEAINAVADVAAPF